LALLAIQPITSTLGDYYEVVSVELQEFHIGINASMEMRQVITLWRYAASTVSVSKAGADIA
tara:strand:+ start:91 stop:276 length:186 start_codon:yes stop_codon:yes gene_type:complete